MRAADVKFVADVTRGDLDSWSVGEVICNHARELRAAAIVMAPHGKGRMKEFFVGRCAAPGSTGASSLVSSELKKRKIAAGVDATTRPPVRPPDPFHSIPF